MATTKDRKTTRKTTRATTGKTTKATTGKTTTANGPAPHDRNGEPAGPTDPLTNEQRRATLKTLAASTPPGKGRYAEIARAYERATGHPIHHSTVMGILGMSWQRAGRGGKRLSPEARESIAAAVPIVAGPPPAPTPTEDQPASLNPVPPAIILEAEAILSISRVLADLPGPSAAHVADWVAVRFSIAGPKVGPPMLEMIRSRVPTIAELPRMPTLDDLR